MASDGFIHVFPVKKDKTPRTGKVAGGFTEIISA
jgi:hypothetical protein